MNSTITLFTHAEFDKHLQEHSVIQNYYQTPAGDILLQQTELGIFSAAYPEPAHPELVEGLAGLRDAAGFQKIILVGTDFQIKVWQAALQIPMGITVTYHDIACAIGKPKAYRAVANALGDNKIVYFVPCHRVLRKDGKLGGYRYGVDKKIALLAAERVNL